MGGSHHAILGQWLDAVHAFFLRLVSFLAAPVLKEEMPSAQRSLVT
jgi:hypothetical protein